MPEKTVPNPPAGDDPGRPHEGTRAQERYVAPPVDIYETPEGLIVVADLPGVSGAEVAAVMRRLYRRSYPKLIAYGNAHRHREPRPGTVFDAWLAGPVELRALMAELMDERPSYHAEHTARA